jgi:hypothetical protein
MIQKKTAKEVSDQGFGRVHNDAPMESDTYFRQEDF